MPDNEMLKISKQLLQDAPRDAPFSRPQPNPIQPPGESLSLPSIPFSFTLISPRRGRISSHFRPSPVFLYDYPTSLSPPLPTPSPLPLLTPSRPTTFPSSCPSPIYRPLPLPPNLSALTSSTHIKVP